MSLCSRNVLAAVIAAGLALSTTSAIQAQQPPASRPAQAPAVATTPAANPARAAMLAKANEALATVNGEPITRGEVIEWLSQFPIQAGEEQEAYEGAVTELSNAKLIGQFLKKMRVPIKKEELDADLARWEQNILKPQKVTLAQFFADSGMSLDELKSRFGEKQQWHTYLLSRATDPELKKYFENRKEIFEGKQVRASHILLKIDPAATSADKEKVKQKLMAIRSEIVSKKISFADAANKYSEDEMGGTKNGGDLDYFPRRGRYIDAFADAAFTMKEGEISQPILTEYGWHLLQQTGVMPGQPVDFAQIKERVLDQYAQDLHEAIVDSERKKAKIDVKPLPNDLFPKLPPPATAPAPSTAPAPAPSAKPAAPKPQPPK